MSKPVAAPLIISKFGAELSIAKVTLDKASVNLYSVAADSVTKEPALDEYEIVLSSKPKSNIFTLPFTTKDLVFYYQPPLTQELDPKEYDSITETEAWKDGKLSVSRPENVVGSYAVYHASKSGGVYGTGKAFHIYRPWAEDVKGVRVWCSLKVEKDTFTITVPQIFLDKAVYPVVVDPTFGYTSIGASAYYGDVGYMVSSKVVSPAAGTATKIWVYYKEHAGVYSGNVKAALYDASKNYLEKTDEQAFTDGDGAKWFTFTLDNTVAISATTYFITTQHSDWFDVAYDSGASSGDSGLYALVYGAFPASYTHNVVNDDRFLSMYVEYTAASTYSPKTRSGLVNTMTTLLNSKILFS
jgi:hypothetical protein